MKILSGLVISSLSLSQVPSLGVWLSKISAYQPVMRSVALPTGHGGNGIHPASGYCGSRRRQARRRAVEPWRDTAEKPPPRPRVFSYHPPLHFPHLQRRWRKDGDASSRRQRQSYAMRYATSRHAIATTHRTQATRSNTVNVICIPSWAVRDHEGRPRLCSELPAI